MKKFIFVLLFLFMPFMIKAVDIGISDTDINSITFNKLETYCVCF